MEPQADCTFDQGYIRQKVFVCRRCTPSGGRAGFCAACKDRCHGDHEADVLPIYSKRGFRCDCGTAKMKNRCSLASPVAARARRQVTNEGNTRGHNFDGRYCGCNRLYSPEHGDMLQCAVCEDWWHEPCMGFPTRRSESRGHATGRIGGGASGFEIRYGERGRFPSENFEFSCHECTKRLPFLADYYPIRGVELPHTLTGVDLTAARNKKVGDGCSRPAPSRLAERLIQSEMDFFWASHWRYDLCGCQTCSDMYTRLGCQFLVDKTYFLFASDEDGEGAGGSNDDGEDDDDSEVGQAVTPADAAQAIADMVRRGDLSRPRDDDEDVLLFARLLEEADTGAGPIDTEELARVYGKVKRQCLALLRKHP
ncbi:hypothetical protein BU14_0438s0004 [Porphyra umbilicalis]|uniref:UBR-type domain-containing protein n=1 Tax=Porphyra umbilicalis TaxID=2786 RepID=A0A1X6NUW3_PORUM|nr:hypothetical protein BU14_0438s0004 [Porphyra umbilicalis]|eukprot:OSX72409.1 hypothetical protein BU14_0438s0004 [Porphyra umbilicalis]